MVSTWVLMITVLESGHSQCKSWLRVACSVLGTLYLFKDSELARREPRTDTCRFGRSGLLTLSLWRYSTGYGPSANRCSC